MAEITKLNRDGSELPAPVLDFFKGQLLIVFLKRMGGEVTIPLEEVNDTGQDILTLNIDIDNNFHFAIKKKH